MLKSLGKRWREKTEFGLFTLPVLICIAVAFYIPFAMTIRYSMTKWNGISKHPKFVGLDNFKQIFMGDTNFANSAWFTIKYAILYIVLVNVLAILLALVLDMKLKSTPWLRAAFFIPYILSLVIVGFIWKFIFMQGFNSLGESTGWSIFGLSWLGTPGLAFVSILAVSIWQSIGFYLVIYIAGLQSVPEDLKEAATVDGAGPMRKFFSITLPLLAPSITISVFMALTNSIKVFDVILSLTGGGPGGTTYSIAYDIYRDTFQNNLYGYGTAKALILFLAVLVVTILQLAFFKRREVEA
ncbi:MULTISPECIES: sugar ABC transporter permease [Paenibacillus]|jgi:raffinose/stachyose/melibiose transport system permease protein|uniref:ABC transporter permease n=1 Tax=Paenibacillus odorifer TaxID=189426 RepID=A0A1R0WZH6_9BACL|nr:MULTISPECIES: sugar ABC transporter permease [Paenibacillus]AIQ73389.1 ABC transporter permease [Paenibacillus odorifer]AWV32737.1 sugar ABC transporter permease [Paenibacillus odorifer]ETT55764.1 binding-protein-dependent transport system inner membrane protein [Paenibacillus sp. FSL H8-237]MDH6426222.1 raffinose/stachyose/melibiose transport system permease protein [Paenibacillus sp. PastH-4]MDH6442244.1 raffinose/stachyose/melibiose transport system permease protein [Paenibacillus sp. Pa